MKKKLLGILLTVMLVVIAFTLCASAATTISTAEELIALMNTADPATDWAKDYVLGGDIDLSTAAEGSAQAPIGNSTTLFTGNFDGAGHTISGLSLSGDSQIGLFGTIKGSTIKNITVSGETSAATYTGGVVGVAFAPVKLENVVSKVTVKGTGNYAGGVIATAYYTSDSTDVSVINCVNTGAVSGGAYVGGVIGIIGSGFSSAPVPAAASVTTKSNTATVEGCYNFGKVTASKGNCVGGIMGYYTHRASSSKGMSYLTVTECANHGVIAGTASSKGYAGGIVGGLNDNTRYVDVTLTKLLNTAKVSAKDTTTVGTIVGLLRPTKLTNGVTPLYVADIVNTYASDFTMIVTGTLSGAIWTAERLYNAGGTTVINDLETLDGTVSTKSNTITINDCVDTTSDAEALAALAASDAFVDIFGVPSLKAFSYLSSPEDVVLVSSYTGLWKLNYKLANNIDISEYPGTYIGNSSTKFTGMFDGAGFEISGININATSMGSGFFGGAQNAVIKNLTLSGEVNSTSSRLAGFVGYSFGSLTIENCVNNVTVTANAGAAGGIVGAFLNSTGEDYLTIKNCVNNADITGSAFNGGILGYVVNSTSDDTTILNIVVNIDNCVNNGNITSRSTSSNFAGGIFGYCAAIPVGGVNTFTITNCGNYGDVSTAAKYAGGIIGGMGGSANLSYTYTFTMDNCYNEGEITGSTSGGIMGIIRPADVESGGAQANLISNIMSNDKAGRAIIGGFGSGSSSVSADYIFTNAYSVNGTVVESTATKNYTITGDIYTKDSTADELNTLAAKEKWVGSAEYGVELASFHNHTPIYVIDGANGHSSFCLCLDESQNTALTPHTFDELDVCTACGYTDCKHAAADYVVTLPATCVATGLKDFVCPTCESVLEKDVEVPIDANNHAENGVYMVVNKTSVDYFHDCCDALVLSDTTLSTTIYVSTKGNDLSAGVTAPVGYTSETAFKNFEDAMVLAAAVANIKDTDVTIQIVDKATITTGSYATPAYENMITITGGELAFTSEATRFYQLGDVTVRDVKFNNAAAVVWSAKGHKIVMDTGITHAAGAANMYVLGGFQGTPAAEFTPDVTIRSGDWYCVTPGNRQQGSTGCVTNGSITLGTANDTDTLTIGNFYPFHMGGGNISADSTVTIVVDGKVNITSTFYANIQTTSTAVGAEHTYTVNYVLKQNAVVTRTVELTNIEHSTIVWNVYADQRNEAAKAEAARIVGADNLTVNQYTYVQYCKSILGGHFGEGENCTECGGVRVCNHEGTEKTWVVVTPSTCNVKGTEKEVCSCENDTGVTRELELDATNHKDNTNLAWTQNAESGAYEIICSECGGAYLSQTELPTVYLANFSTFVGDDAADGLTADTAVASLVEAVNRIKAVGGTVAIVKGYSLGAEHVLPEWNGTITFTSATFDSNGAATAGFNITKQNVELHLGGKAVFDDILFKGTSRKNAVNGSTTYTSDVFRAIISCHWNDVDFGYIRVQQYATVYLLAGEYGVTENDTAEKTTKMTIDGPALSTRALPYFFERVYLGSSFSKGGLEVSNKTVTLEVENGVINSKSTTRGQKALVYTIYTMSTTSTNAYGTSTCNNCTSTVTLDDDSSVVAFRTGDRNASYDMLTNGKTGDALVEYGPSAGKLDKLTVNLLGNSQITDVAADDALAVSAATGSFQVKNAKDTTINVSSKEEGRTVELLHSFSFYKYGTFADEEATVTVNAGNHSFVSSITKCANYAAAASGKRPYTVLKDVVDECTYDEGEITTEATPEKDGVITYTCTECGRKYTESYSYDCTDHNYVAKVDGTYYCAKDGEILNAPDAETIVALSPAMAQDGQVKVDVTVSANALWSAIFSVNAPAGFELADVSSALDGDFVFVGADEIALPYSMAIMGTATDENGNLANGSIDEVVVTLTFNVTENVVGSKHVFTIVLDNVYDADGTEIGGEAVSAEVFACAHADTAVTTTATCTEGGVKTTVCNICNEVIKTEEDGALGHDYESEVISTVSPTTAGVVRYTCKRCGDTYDDITLPTGSATLTAVAGQIADGKVSVQLRLDADAVSAVLFSVNASAGLTLESVNDNANDTFHVEAAESGDMPRKIVIINLDGTNAALDNALVATLVFAVDEDAMGESGDVILSAIECINADENGIYMHTVNATVIHNCKYECVFVADTAEKDAHYLYTCTVCGGTYEEVAVAQEYTASYGSTVILESDLALQVVANIADKITDASKIWLIVESTDASGNVIREVVRPYQAYPQNKEQTAFIYRFNATRVSAKNIVDDIRVTLCVEKDGIKYAANTVNSNIISYYAAAKNAGAPEAIINALDAMMNYGAAAQEYFKYSTDKLATSLAGAQKIDYSTDTSVSVNASTTYGDENITAYTYKSLSAVLEDKVVMVIKYNGAAADGLVFKGTYTDINGKAITFEKAAVVKSGVVTVEIDAIAAKDLRQAFTGALYNGDVQVSSSVTTSFEAYATQAINDIDNPKLNAVCRAALAYSDAAAAYFRTK